MTKGNPNIAKHGFKPGQSGNPGGRPKGIAAKAREHGDKAIEVLVEALADDDVKTRIQAAEKLLDRGFGKSGNFIDLDIGEQLSSLSVIEAISKITDAVSKGELSTDDGSRLIGLIESRMKAVELEKIEKRISKLEQQK